HAVATAKPNDAASQYKAALAQSYVAEVAIEVRDNGAARSAAETGIKSAEKAIALQPANAEYHRILGTLCGQVLPAAKLMGLKYGRCALDSVNKAIELDPKHAENYLARGVGNYYLPAAFGGGIELAIKDFEKAASLNPKLAEAYLWLGVAERKAGRNPDARKAFQKSLDLNPNRLWAKQQLDKTPAQ
ncbi:MAG: tetratricopeptide repeat protein, partial [Bryobacteraceae bacterium]